MGLKGKGMHETPPGLVEQTLKWAGDYLPALYAAGTATAISVLMGFYDGKSALKTIMGSLSCGVLTLTIAGSLEFFGLPENSVTFVGAVIGFVGAEKIRDKLSTWFDRRTGSNDENK